MSMPACLDQLLQQFATLTLMGIEWLAGGKQF